MQFDIVLSQNVFFLFLYIANVCIKNDDDRRSSVKICKNFKIKFINSSIINKGTNSTSFSVPGYWRQTCLTFVYVSHDTTCNSHEYL